MRSSLKGIISPGIPLAVLLVLSCILLWFSAYFGSRFAQTPLQSPAFANGIESVISPNSLLSNIVSIGFVLLNALLLAQINNRFTIIRIRTFMPVFVFLLIMASWNETHIANSSHLVLLLVILSLFNFFSMSRDRKASEPAFLGSFLLSASAILFNPLVFLLPVCWIGFIIFQSFSLRTFLASVFGMATPWILLLAVIYGLHSQLDIQQIFSLRPSLEFPDISVYSLPILVYSTVFLIISILSIAAMYALSYSDSIHTRNKLNFLVLFMVSIVVLAFLFRNHLPMFLPLIAFIFSLLFSHPFTLKQNNFNLIVFVVFCLLNIVYVISKYLLI